MALKKHAGQANRPLLLLAGGEPTVQTMGNGRGGRMQHLALALAMAFQGQQGIVGLAAGTDGTDGPTDVAGAFFSSDTVARANALALSPEQHLRQFDSYPLFAALGDHLLTGPTGTNVMDLVMVLLTE